MNAPDLWVKQHIDLSGKSVRVLDIAAGSGRHTRLALSLGHQVLAVDRDVSGMADLTDNHDCALLEADLEGEVWPLTDQSFDCVIVCNYLWRPIFPSVLDCVAEGGILIWTTFMEGNAAFGRPKNPDFLLGSNELLDAFTGDLEVVGFRQGKVERPQPAMRQSIVARRPAMDRTVA